MLVIYDIIIKFAVHIVCGAPIWGEAEGADILKAFISACS